MRPRGRRSALRSWCVFGLPLLALALAWLARAGMVEQPGLGLSDDGISPPPAERFWYSYHQLGTRHVAVRIDDRGLHLEF